MAMNVENEATSLLETPVEMEGGSVEQTFKKSQTSLAYRIFKRMFDFVFSLFMSLILLLPMAVVALLIVIKDPGNPFYIQTRVGQNGKALRLLKFRSMKKGADHLEEMLTPEQLIE